MLFRSAPENINSDDEPVFAEPEDLPEPDLSRKTRRFSQLGFLMTFCTAGLTAASAVSDAAKIRVIGHIEREKGIQCSAKPWGLYSTIEQTKIIRCLNKSWSKHFNSWRLCMQRMVCGLFSEPRDPARRPTRSYFQARAPSPSPSPSLPFRARPLSTFFQAILGVEPDKIGRAHV